MALHRCPARHTCSGLPGLRCRLRKHSSERKANAGPSPPGPQDLETKTQQLPEVDLDAVPALDEPEDDRDGLAEYSFPKFAATYFQKSASHTHVRKPLRYPLLYHEDDADCSVRSSAPAARAHGLSLRCGSEQGAGAGPGTRPRTRLQQASVSLSAGRPGCVERHPEVHGRPPGARALRQDAAGPGRRGQGGQRPASTARICTGTWVRVVAAKGRHPPGTHQPAAPGEARHRAPHRLTLKPRGHCWGGSQAPVLGFHSNRTERM